MDLNINGKHAIVTGASRGIGLAIVAALVREGVQVAAAARQITPELRATGALVVAADLSTPEGCNALVDAALDEFGSIDFLINNVGGGTTTFGFFSSDDDEWAQAFELNLFSAVRTARAALPSIIDQRGAIINVSSTAAHIPSIAPVPYSAAKAAVTALSKSLSEEFGSFGVRVNTISPGLVRTPVYDAAAAGMGIAVDELATQLVHAQNITTGRMSEPSEIAGVVTFLLSDSAQNITGADYIVDGGGNKSR